MSNLRKNSEAIQKWEQAQPVSKTQNNVERWNERGIKKNMIAEDKRHTDD